MESMRLTMSPRLLALLGAMLVLPGAVGVLAQTTPGAPTPSLLPSEQVTAEALARGYAGPAACRECHAAQYDAYRASGHPSKLRPAAEARLAGLPLPDGYEWDQISYVIGGHRWKARYMDAEGFIITSTGPDRQRPGANQYNLATGRWVDYHAGEKKPYDCGECHTTGFSAQGHQDGRPGILGTWALPGVTCEACHGPGLAHVKAPAKGNIRNDSSAAACGKCHVRGSADTIPASGGFIRHHEQYNEHLVGPHAGKIDCTTCHDPHKRAAVSIRLQCEACHARQAEDYEGSAKQRAGVSCVDCHMPPAGKSAESFGRYQGDVKTHIAKISIGEVDQMFTADGKLATGKLTVDFACLRCHAGRDTQWARANARNVHTLGK